MYDLSREFEKFYRNKVVLSASVQSDLRKKKNLNITRLKEGLLEYNEEKGTNYKICDDRVQGSVAMHTVVQNDEKDYDIDVAIVFEKDNLNDLGPLATRNMVANALKKKTQQFNVEPEVKTSCVRIKYAEGYHIDFAIYRRYKLNESDDDYQYEHAGAEWSERGVNALENWFVDEIKFKGKDLRKIIRLSKMFCKSRDLWVNMPSGLIQTILCDEKLSSYERIDEKFYYTMESIIDRLDRDIDVNAPVDNGRALTSRKIDETRVENWKNRLKGQIEKLQVLFDDDCTYEDAIEVWHNFFNHNYWSSFLEKSNLSCYSKTNLCTEEFIEDIYPVNEKYDVTIDCRVMGDGFRIMPISDFIDKYIVKFGGFIPHHFTVKAKILRTSASSFDKVLWKVRNVGEIAEMRGAIRGDILERGDEIIEQTVFMGQHYIECYIIKDGVCVGIGHVKVPIGNE